MNGLENIGDEEFQLFPGGVDDCGRLSMGVDTVRGDAAYMADAAMGGEGRDTVRRVAERIGESG